MTMTTANPPAPRVSSIGKNQFKCFHCRHLFNKKDGQWMNWEQMQVMLCKDCDKVTAKAPERSR